jgi:hypothetical protein
MIALRARRTAYRVASCVLLFQRSKPLTIECVGCHQPFVPVKNESICSQCRAASPDPTFKGPVPLLLTREDRQRLIWVRPTPGEWATLIVVFFLLALSLWAYFHDQSY